MTILKYSQKIRQIEGGSVLLSYFMNFFAVFDHYSFFFRFFATSVFRNQNLMGHTVFLINYLKLTLD